MLHGEAFFWALEYARKCAEQAELYPPPYTWRAQMLLNTANGWLEKAGLEARFRVPEEGEALRRTPSSHSSKRP